ncbi:hypothetical protein PAPYR_6331 [Paratrimastix pyriformis]|uniref:Phosphoglycerate mutase n=1 Tax=Paratrimastix pyriformis TaxID=342808 RepID=A0ABQ8UI37_9EUKA|nr:hypothetical protein PAPYR_6331 [Paratrimastix pyriformis]
MADAPAASAVAQRRDVWLLRHCESEFNSGKDKLGHDVPLTERGFAQAALIEGVFDVVALSPLRRAQQTLYSSKIKAHQIIVLPELREIKKDPCDYLLDEVDPHVDESEESVARRVQAVLTWAHSQTAPRVLLVGHADFFFALTRAKGPDGDDYGRWLENGECISVVL